MVNFISGTTKKLSLLINSIQTKHFLSLILIFPLLLNTYIGAAVDSKIVTKKLDEVVHQDDSQRPKTTGEWNREAREVKGEPGERIKRIGKQSAEAVKEFGSMYPDVAQKSAAELENRSNADR